LRFLCAVIVGIYVVGTCGLAPFSHVLLEVFREFEGIAARSSGRECRHFSLFSLCRWGRTDGLPRRLADQYSDRGLHRVGLADVDSDCFPGRRDTDAGGNGHLHSDGSAIGNGRPHRNSRSHGDAGSHQYTRSGEHTHPGPNGDGSGRDADARTDANKEAEFTDSDGVGHARSNVDACPNRNADGQRRRLSCAF
jgi:hypothetical protein